MVTIGSKSIIDKIIKNNGYYEDDPQVYMIVEYTNAWGSITWGVTWPHEQNKDKYLIPSQFVRNPKVIWKAQD